MVVHHPPQVIDLAEESQAGKLARKSRDEPLVPIGIKE